MTIKFEKTAQFEVSAQDVANAIINMNSIEQAEVLNELAKVYRLHFPEFVMQLEYIRCSINESCTKEEKDRIKAMVHELMDYLESEEEI